MTRGDSAFTLYIPDSVTKLGKFVFGFVYDIRSIVFGSDSQIKVVNGFAELAITSILIPSSVVLIDAHAFRYCEFLRTIEFEADSSLCEIGRMAFYATALSVFRSPPPLQFVREFAFSDCVVLRDISFCSGLESLDCSVFSINGNESRTFVSYSDEFLRSTRRQFHDRQHLTSLTRRDGTS
jgi:hypothetical protein